MNTQQNFDRYKNLIVVLTVFTTVLAAALAALQADASIRADIANRDSQYLAVLASGELTRAGLESNYELNVFGDYLKNLQQATVLELTALEQETDGNDEAAQASRALASISQSSADAGEKFSIFHTDPRYAPQSENDLPNAEQYLTDVFEKVNEIVAQQNEAADAYHVWDRKTDSYITALTVLAVAFFLFGLAQALKDVRVRLIFAIFGVVVIAFSLLITVTALLQ
ncbi:MAG TPA: hypothetical protein VKE92_11315 [Anaerolineales bacterium]|nr:hypothetical protein [Anaerolineales bacterium]